MDDVTENAMKKLVEIRILLNRIRRGEIDGRAHTMWEKADTNYRQYLSYIEKKPNKFELTEIDLLYIRNFKGGNASISLTGSVLEERLKEYAKQLQVIHDEFGDKYLRDLSKPDLESLKEKATSFICLTLDKNLSFSGFKCIHASTLLHFHFPNLTPILDSRVLNGTGILPRTKQAAIPNAHEYYPQLIDHAYGYLRANPEKTLREYDKEHFIKPTSKGKED